MLTQFFFGKGAQGASRLCVLCMHRIHSFLRRTGRNSGKNVVTFHVIMTKRLNIAKKYNIRLYLN